MTFQELADEVQRKLKLTNVKKYRLFNVEGVEIYAEDMDCIADKSVLYVSKGNKDYIINKNKIQL